MRVWMVYALDDRERAGSIREALHEAGIETWIAEDTVAPGGSITEGISRGMSAADAIVILMSKKSLHNTNVLGETAYAFAASAGGTSKPVIPVRLEQVEPPPELRDFKYIDLSEPARMAEGTRALARAVESFRPIGEDALAESVEQFLHAQAAAITAEQLRMLYRRRWIAVVTVLSLFAATAAIVVALLSLSVLGFGEGYFLASILVPLLTSMFAATIGYYFATRL